MLRLLLALDQDLLQAQMFTQWWKQPAGLISVVCTIRDQPRKIREFQGKLAGVPLSGLFVRLEGDYCQAVQ